MSSFPHFPEAVPGRPFAFEQKLTAIGEQLAARPRLAEVVPASRLEVRPAPEMVSSGIVEMDALTGGLPRGCLTEICGGASSGRTSLLLATLAAATRRQEACALVDVSDALDPVSAASAGVQFERLLWVRCGTAQKIISPRRHPSTSLRAGSVTEKFGQKEAAVEQALRVTDLLLQSGGFGLVMIDLGDVAIKTARRIPLTSWFRFQRAVERTPTVLFVITQSPCTQSCAGLVVKVKAKSLVPSLRSGQAENGRWSSAKERSSSDPIPPHTELLDGLHVEGELLRSRMQRKPAQSVKTTFATNAIQTG